MGPLSHRCRLAVLAASWFLVPTALWAATFTSVSGNVYDGAGGPWTLAGSPYRVTADVTVPAGQTLTIQPGVVVKFNYLANSLIVSGRLVADGTSEARIVFTSERDDTVGGDTNGDGNTAPGKGWWGCLRFRAASSGSVLDQVEVRYGGWGAAGAVWVDGGQLALTNSILRSSSVAGVRIETSDPVLTGNTYQGNDGAAISMNLAANPAIVGATVSDNHINGLVLDAGTVVGNGVWDDPDLVYVLYGDVTVPAAAILTIAAGQKVKFGYGSVDLILDGTLLAHGSAAAPVVFTSDRDDAVGGDTNADGNHTPGRGTWGGLKFTPSSDGNQMTHCEVRYGGWDTAGEVQIAHAGVTMADCTLRSSSSSGIRVTGAAPVLQHMTFADNVVAAVSMDLGSSPAMTGVTLTNNGVNGLKLDAGTLSGDSSWDDPDITYCLSGNVTVPPGVTLTVVAGQVVKIPYGAHDLVIQGTLLADGSATTPIVFTSDRDDSAGGDTNNNGIADSPYAGIWGCLSFAATSVGSALDHVETRYGGGWGTPGSVCLSGAQLNLTRSTVYRSASAGVRIVSSHPILTDTVFERSAGAALSMDLVSNPAIHGVTLTNNGFNGIRLDAGTLAGDGFWDDPEIAYRLSGSTVIPAGTTLTVAPGQVIKQVYGAYDLVIEGRLNATGTALAPIVFTSDRDDTAMGDSNNDAGASWPYAGIWGGLEFRASSTGSLLQHVTVRYGGWDIPGGIYANGAQMTLDGCTVFASSASGLRLEHATPVLTGCRVEGSAWSAISLDLSSDPTITGVTLVNNGANALRFDAGALPGDAVWDDTDIVHLLSGDLTVPAGRTLTLAPGLIVKVAYGSNDLSVDGTLLARGRADAPVILSSERDDSAGGDTNNTTGSPYAGIWGGLKLNQTSQGSVLEYVDLRYGGWESAAGILIDGCRLPVRQTHVSHSSTRGLSAQNGAVVEVVNAVFQRNSGSGAAAVSGSTVTMTNSTLHANGTGAYVADASAILTNTLITGSLSAGVHVSGAAGVTLAHCDIYNPTAAYGNYRDMPGQTGLNGNLSADPLYGSTGVLPYQLQEGSPAIDAGSSADAPVRDFLGLLRYDHPGIPNAESGLRGGVDLGAFEYGGLAPLDIDLVTSLVSGPSSATQNGTVRVTWRVTNTGTDAADSVWYDAVYLSTDTTWSADDRLVGSLPHTGGLAAGDVYSAVLDILLQGVVPGNLYFIVVSDVRHETREGGTHDNNAAATASTATFAMPQLALGVASVGSFAVVGDLLYYRLVVPSGSNLLVTLDDADDVGLNELYLNRDTPPTVGTSQYSSVGSGDRMVALPAAPAGTWYIALRNAAGTGGYSLLAETTRLGLYRVTPEAQGNAAALVLTLDGAGFAAGTAVHLVPTDGAPYAGAVAVDSYRRLTVTFPAGSVPAGVYGVRVTDSGTAEAAALAAAFTVLAGGEAHFSAELAVPGSIGYHQLATVYVSYRNTGTLAMPAPLVLVTALQHAGGIDRRAGLLTLDRGRLTQGLWTSARPDGFTHTVHFLAAGASPGILQPGESARVPVYYAGWLQPWEFSYPPIRFALSWVTADNPQSPDWATLKTMLQPSGIESGAWDAVWANFSGSGAANWGEFVRRLGGESARLARLGRDVTAVADLLGSQLLQAEGVGPVPYLNAGVDLGRPAPGLPLLFSRLLPNAISCRWRLGPLGRGWCHNWEIAASREADGTVTVIRHGFLLERYQPDSRGGYLSEPGNPAVLSARADGGLTLTFPAGSRLVFAATGVLAAMEDLTGNRIMATFSGGRLTQLDHSSGYRFTLTYNPAGRIARVADAAGDSASFTYDAAAEHLLGAAYSDGRSAAWEYVQPPSQAAHALSRMTLADGTVHLFDYDAQGRIAGMSRAGEAARVRYGYSEDGDATVTRGDGTVRAAFDDRGLPCRFTSASGAVFLAEYGPSAQLSRVMGPTGQRVEFERDPKGLVTAVTSSAGRRTVFERGPFGQVTALTDALGRRTSYRYDLAGNPIAMVYPDGSERLFTYAAQGLLTRLTNRRGQGVAFAYDSQRRPLRADFQNSADTSVSYTPRGAFATLVDRFGTTSFTYDAQGWLTSTDLPGGRRLAFTHDRLGRRATATDDTGFALVYAYDDQGRLQAISAGAGAPFVTYTYDAHGRLSGETRGNGTTCAYTYGADGRLLGIVHRAADLSVLSHFAYRYDAVGQVVQATSNEGVWTYQYEPGGRLARAALVGSGATPSTVIHYTYDAAGNCIGRDIDGVAEARTANGLNQIVQAGATTYTYDADGNLIEENDGVAPRRWAYDELGRLSGATTALGDWSRELDGLGRCGAADGPEGRSVFVHDPQRRQIPWAEYDEAGTLKARYINGIGLVCRIAADGTVHYYDFERTGSTVGVSGPGGAGYLNRYSYLPFGEASIVQEASANRFRFVGRWGVTWHGSGLYQMGLRWYHPGLGRFTSPDPLGQSVGINLYRYAANNPLRYIDPAGASFDEIDLSMFTDAKAFVMAVVHEGADRLYHVTEELTQVNERISPNFDGWSARQETERLRRAAAWGEDAFESFVDGLKELGAGGGGDDDDEDLTSDLIEVKDWLVENFNEIEGPNWVVAEVFYHRVRETGSTLYDYAARLEAPDWDRLIDDLRTTWDWQDEQPVASRDPNAKTGPAGLGAANYVAGGSLLSYRIDFENDASASAPAQHVALRDQLSSDLDWSSFELTEIGFGDQVLVVPAQHQTYTVTLPLTYLGVAVEVHVGLRFDPVSGQIGADVCTTDPATGLPPPAGIGFLPPEDGSGRGQGYLGYVIRPRTGLASGTAIRNIAVITFDSGEVIATNQVDPHNPGAGTDPTKEALVTIDASGPTSAVAALPALSLPGFLVSWSGTDAGAGIATYTIYVRDNGGPFTAWLAGTSLTEGAYPGVPGHTYGFHSIATDGLGLQEPGKTVAEATTVVGYGVVFEAGPHGSLNGPTTQFVAPGGSTSAVTALPAAGYHFWRWTQDGAEVSTADSLIVVAVHGAMALVAEFAIDQYTLTYSAGPHGAIVGDSPQTVSHGASGMAVEALPDPGYVFVGWSDTSPANPRTDANVSAALAVTALFREAEGVSPDGVFLARIEAAEAASDRGLWDLTGTYATTLGGNELTLHLRHDTRGRLSGSATLQVNTGKALIPVTMPIRGRVKGARGALLASLALQGTDPTKAVAVSLSYSLTLNPAARQLRGPVSGSLKVDGVPTAVPADMTLDLPSGMDGRWTVRYALAQDGRAVGGTAVLTLANGVDFLLTVRGRRAGTAAVLSLAGQSADPESMAIKIRTTLETLEGGQARMAVFSGVAYGQALAW